MFRFEHNVYLLLILLIPVALGVFYWYKKRQEKEWGAFAQKDQIQKFSYGIRPVLTWKSMILWSAIGILGVITLANPQFNSKNAEVKIESTDVFIALDISHSMLANDLKPNRLTRAKNLAQQIVESLEGNRVGLILFAGEAYMFMPLTNDVTSAISFVQAANTNMAPTQGTAIAAAINLALTSFDEENDAAKSIVLISDGEDHEQEIDEAAEKAKEENVFIFTVAIGTGEGTYLPGLGQDNYLFDENGKPVKSIVNTKMLKSISDATKATAFNLSTERNIDQAIANNINQMEKQVGQVARFNAVDSYFQYFLFPILLILLWQLFRQSIFSTLTRNKDK